MLYGSRGASRESRPSESFPKGLGSFGIGGGQAGKGEAGGRLGGHPRSFRPGCGMIRAESSQPGWWQPNLGRWQPQPGMTATQPAQQRCKLCCEAGAEVCAEEAATDF